jgi:hypothetical protein
MSGRTSPATNTWTLSDYHEYPRFECESLGRLIAVIENDQHWYNTSHDRPGHGEFKGRMSECEPWAFVRTEVYDDLGGDPVSVRDEAARLRLPAFMEGETMRSLQPNPSLLLDTFPVASGFAGKGWSFVCLARPEGPVEPGMVVRDGPQGGYGVVVDSAWVPSVWPVAPGRPFDKKDPSWRLVLARSDLLNDPEFVRDLIEREPEAPAPSLR